MVYCNCNLVQKGAGTRSHPTTPPGYCHLRHAGLIQRSGSEIFLVYNAVVPYHMSEVALSSPSDNMP